MKTWACASASLLHTFLRSQLGIRSLFFLCKETSGLFLRLKWEHSMLATREEEVSAE